MARLFFALWPDQKLRDALFAEGQRMLHLCGGRPMRLETLHMTLLFLGTVHRTKIPALLAAANQVRENAFTLQLEGFSCWRHNRIGYVTPSKPFPQLEALAKTLRQQVAGAEIPFDQRAFSPHVTLLRNITSPSKPVTIPSLEWEVLEFVLVDSVPEGAGRVYRKIAAWPLGS